jgi:hypothetical protein
MIARLMFVPPGGGKSDYFLDFDLPGIPAPGDYVQIVRPGQTGTEDFIVRRTWWHLEYPYARLYKESNDPTHGKVRGITIECEFSRSGHSTDAHSRAANSHGKKSGKLKEF